jgi:RNA polymerase sigma factor (TIGR02999 family)
MADSVSNSVTHLLVKWRAGDEQALNDLMPLVYDELRRLAGSYMRNERAGHTLQPTALVHEAYLRLIDLDLAWQDRAHFFAVAARLMRRLLVDHAKAKHRAKRGSGLKVTLSEDLQLTSEPNMDVIALDEAIQRLSEFDERKSQIIELHYFGGLSYQETAEALEISPATVDRELRLAKAWLYHELTPKGD